MKSIKILSTETEQAIADLVRAVRVIKSSPARRSPPKTTRKPWSRQKFQRWLSLEQRDQRRRRRCEVEMDQVRRIIAAYHAAVLKTVTLEEAACIRYRFDEAMVALGYERRIKS